MKCFHCGTELPEGARFCSECGEEQGFSEELIRKAKEGDQEAIAELYRRTYPSVYRTVAVLIRDPDTAADILQDAYLKAFQNLDQLRESDKFRPWVKRIAHNRAVDFLRRAKPVLFSQMSCDSEENIELEDPRTGHLPEVVVDKKETARLMDQILGELSDDQRVVIVMYYYEQMSVKEIAFSLGIGENTVKSRLFYGRKSIEYSVRQLEKKGTKLYGLSPVLFFLLLFRNWEIQTKPAADQQILEQLCKGISGIGDSIAGEKIPARSANAVEISRTAAAGGGFLGKKAAVRVLAGLLAVSVGGGAAVFVFRQREKEREAVEVMQEPEVTKEAQVTEEPKVTEEPQVTEVPDKTELLVGHWEGEAQDAFGEYVMTLDFSAEGQADYMLGWKLSEMALLSHGTYTLEGDLLRLVFEKNEITGESMNWECVYRIKTDGEVLEMEYVSGNSLSDFQTEGIRFSYKKTAGVGVQ